MNSGFPVKLRYGMQLGWTAIMALSRAGGFELSGHMAFTAMLSLFPFLIFIAALTGFLGDSETAGYFIDNMFRFFPNDVAKALTPALEQVLTSRRGGLLSIGLLGTIWAAASGVDALRTALDSAYAVKESRPMWFTKLQSITVVFTVGVAVFAASLTIILGPFIWNAAKYFMPVDESLRWVMEVARFVLGLAVLTIAVAILHRYLPNLRPPWRQIWPGALLTTFLWVAGAYLFSLYLGTIADYGATYGSLAGVIITLLFFYIAALMFIFGAEINAVLRGQRQPAMVQAVADQA